MDIKIISSSGELYLNDKLDVEFYKDNEKEFEIIQQIILMLNIRQGELVYNTNYGLSYKILFEGHGNNINQITEHIRNQILKYFNKEIKSILSIEREWSGEHMRELSFKINLTFWNNKSYALEGVNIFG